MILRSKSYERKAPSIDAKMIIIYCEGRKREFDYFKYFIGISSKINIEPIELEHDEDNSPVGLYNKAYKDLIDSGSDESLKYELDSVDEVWFVIDTDKWEHKIIELRELCKDKNNWFISQSNPCFETWLYYHYNTNMASFEGMDKSSNWKSFVNNNTFPGGFDSRKHPIYIEDAIKNSKNNFLNISNLASTEVFLVAESFLPFVKDVIDPIKENI